jgi:hypothetical protein
MPELEAPEEEGELDETGIDQKDIELVMQQVRSTGTHCFWQMLINFLQVSCSRAKAVRALKDSGGDLINASMSTGLSDTNLLLSIVSQSWRPANKMGLVSWLFCDFAIHDTCNSCLVNRRGRFLRFRLRPYLTLFPPLLRTVIYNGSQGCQI